MNYPNSLKFFLICILNFWFSLNIGFQAQQAGSSHKVSSPSIVLQNGAKLFSIDQAFNDQVLNDKVVLKNSEISVRKNENDERSLTAIAKKPLKKDLNSQLHIVVLDKQKEILKKVKKEIDRYEENKEGFHGFDFKGFPSPNQFFSANTVSKDYVSPAQSNHNISKLYTLSDAYLITRALDYLHSQKYTYYNNKSLRFCFSEVFSVRPPPVLG